MVDESSLVEPGADPLALARQWLAEARDTEPCEANAAALATVDAAGAANARMVLVKEIATGAAGGLVFYTNLDSVKGRELAGNATAALVLHWKSSGRQLRARGPVEPVTASEADAYFGRRPLQSRYGAWASRQSRPLVSRAALLAEVARVAARHPAGPPRPPFWSGFRVRPLEIEFWSSGAFRLHDRIRCSRAGIGADVWQRVRLQP